MIGRSGTDDEAHRLGQLRRRAPGDTTLRNLLGVLDQKLELCASLPVYEWEAGNEGHEASAQVFHHLADAERRTCNEVLEALHAYLESSTSKRRRGA